MLKARTTALLRRLLCLLLALSLAVPTLGMAHAMPAADGPGAVADAGAAAASTQPGSPCPMHAAMAAEADEQQRRAESSAAELADCCTQMAGAHQGCGDDCSGCAGGCGSLRPPAGLDSLDALATMQRIDARPDTDAALNRPDAPQPNLLRPPALA